MFWRAMTIIASAVALWQLAMDDHIPAWLAGMLVGLVVSAWTDWEQQRGGGE